ARGVPPARRAAVRLLHLRHDPVGAGPADEGPGTEPRGHRPRHERQHLPLRRLPAHRRRHRAGRQGDEGRWQMSPRDFPFEPERCRLCEAQASARGLTRRDFFRLVGGGLVVGFLLSECPGDAFGQRPGGQGPTDLGAWLHVGEDSKVTVYTGKVEIGQNIRTSLTQAVAEELHVPPDQIRFIMADTQLGPTDPGTFGSQTTPRMASQMRRVAATARELLLDMAAEESKVERKSLTIKDGKVVGPDGKPTFEFGKLTKGKKLAKALAN